MKILVIGGLGSIGSRYVAILKYLGHEPIIWDPKEPQVNIEFLEWDRAIIASPTETHYEWCKKMIELDKPFLCEKPLSKSIKECKELAKTNVVGFVVNNYWHAMGAYGDSPQDTVPIYYNYYKTGNDGLYWDACQLIYMNFNVELKTDSPIFTLETSRGHLKLENIERSYIDMVDAFIKFKPREKHSLWNLTNGMEMTSVVLGRIEKDKCT